MLDILGNVFGRSKKERGAGGQAGSASGTEAAGSSDGFTVVGQDAAGQGFLYPTMLTNEVRCCCCPLSRPARVSPDRTEPLCACERG